MGKEITQDIFWESRSLMCDKVREITESYQTYPLFLTQYQQQQFQSGNACWGSTTLLLLGKQIITKVISWKLAAQREEKWPPKAWTQNLTCLDQLINSFFIYLFFFSILDDWEQHCQFEITSMISLWIVQDRVQLKFLTTSFKPLENFFWVKKPAVFSISFEKENNKKEVIKACI